MGQEALGVDRPVEHERCNHPSQVRPARNVRRIANGTCADIGPGVKTRHHGCRQVSSKKIKGDQSPSRRHASRRSATSGRSCSLACTVLFEADLLGGENRDRIDLSAYARCARSRRSAIASSVRSSRSQSQCRFNAERRSAPGRQNCCAARFLEPLTQWIALAIPTPTRKIRAASFRVRPASTTALITQIGRASPCAIPASPPPRLEDESRVACLGIPCFNSISTRSHGCDLGSPSRRYPRRAAVWRVPVRLSQLESPIVLTTIGRYRSTVDAVCRRGRSH